MIRMNYINDTYAFESDNIVRSYNKYLDSCLDDMEPVFSEYSLICDKIDLELMMMESTSEENMIIYEEAKKSFLQKVGEKILELRDKFIEFVDKMIDKIKTFTFNHSSNEQKLKKLLKEHPEFKNDTLLAVREGTLNLNNIRSFKELNDDFDKIMDMIKKGNVDPNSLKGKIDAAIEKHEKKLKKAAEIAGATTAVITAAVALATISGKIADNKKKAIEFKDCERKWDKEAYDTLFSIKTTKVSKEEKTSEKTRDVYKRDSNGNIIEDPVFPKKKNGQIQTNGNNTATPLKVFKRDKDGNVIRDNNGNVIMTDVTKRIKVGESRISSKTTTTRTKTSYSYGMKNSKKEFTGESIDSECVTAIMRMSNYRKKSFSKAIGENLTVIERMEYAIGKFIDSHFISDNTKQAFHTKYREGNAPVDKTDTHTTITVQRNINGSSSTRTKNIDKTVDHTKSSS